MAALCKSFICRSSEPFDSFDSPVCDCCFIFLKSKELGFEVLIVEAVIDKVYQIRAYRLGTLCFQKFCQMIVCCRKKFDKNLSDDTNSWLLLSGNRNHIKLMYHLTAHLLKLTMADTASLQERDYPLFPDFMLTVDNSRLHLIWTHTVNTFHQNIAKYRSIADTFDKRKCQFESRIAFQTT